MRTTVHLPAGEACKLMPLREPARAVPAAPADPPAVVHAPLRNRPIRRLTGHAAA
jgi:hypothetical protein